MPKLKSIKRIKISLHKPSQLLIDDDKDKDNDLINNSHNHDRSNSYHKYSDNKCNSKQVGLRVKIKNRQQLMQYNILHNDQQIRRLKHLQLETKQSHHIQYQQQSQKNLQQRQKANNICDTVANEQFRDRSTNNDRNNDNHNIHKYQKMMKNFKNYKMGKSLRRILTQKSAQQYTAIQNNLILTKLPNNEASYSKSQPRIIAKRPRKLYCMIKYLKPQYIQTRCKNKQIDRDMFSSLFFGEVSKYSMHQSYYEPTVTRYTKQTKQAVDYQGKFRKSMHKKNIHIFKQYKMHSYSFSETSGNKTQNSSSNSNLCIQKKCLTPYLKLKPTYNLNFSNTLKPAREISSEQLEQQTQQQISQCESECRPWTPTMNNDSKGMKSNMEVQDMFD